MSKLNKLIQELCPNGVEYRKLGEVCELNRGVRVVKKDLSENGIFPVYQNSLTPLGYYDKSNYPSNTTFVISAGAAGEIGFAEKAIWAADDCLCVTCPDNISNKYVYYCLMNNKTFLFSKVRRASVPRLSRVAVEQFPLPIPPLPIQEEIVKILDRFAEYTAELQAELQARKEQYEYYRNLLLTNNFAYGSADDKQKITGNAREEWKWMTLGEVCEKITSGGTPNTQKSSYYGGNIPWLRTQEVDFCNITDTGVKITEEGLNNSSAKWIPANCVIVAMYGATVGKTGINKIPLTTNQACCNLQINSEIALYKYVYYYLSNKYEYIKSLGQGSQTNISAKIVKNLQISIPPLAEQQRIVSILDKFETLVSDLKQGLPAEIAASQERYEYYRDKLLRFERCN